MAFENPKVVVIGAGAMGSLFGGILAANGLDVTLVNVRRDHVDAINKDGLRLVGYGGERTVRIKATTDTGSIPSADVVLFQCKSHATEEAARSARHLFAGGRAVAVSFQNGLGNEEILASILGAENVLAGLTAQAAILEQPGVVLNFGDLPSFIGEPKGGLSERAVAVAAAFTRHGLKTTASQDIKRDKWKKLLGNVGLSAVSGATDLTSAEIMRVPELRTVVTRAVDEAAAVARACGVDLSADETHEVLDKIVNPLAGGTGGSKSSLRADLVHRRPTEVDYIYGSVARRGREHRVATPTIDTLIGIVKGLESQYRQDARG